MENVNQAIVAKVGELCTHVEDQDRDAAARSAAMIALALRSGPAPFPRPDVTLPAHVFEFLLDTLADELKRPR